MWNTSALLRATGRYPGYHPDDWESYQVRVERNGETFVRASSHHGYKGCKRLHEPLDAAGPAGPGCRAAATPATSR